MKKIWKIKLLQADLKVADLAKKMDKSPGYISKVINRRVSPRLCEVFEIFRILDIPPEDLQEYFGDGSVLDW